MTDRIRIALSGYTKYRGRGHISFFLHRVAGLAVLAYLTLHILTTSTVFFAPQFYNRLIEIFRNPFIMIIEIILSFFVVFHGVNGLRLAYIDLFRPDLWSKRSTYKFRTITFIATFLLWLPALGIMGYDFLKYGLGLFGGG
jgi:succinate dehydrogenase / fumarate reductase cytochrome b subunit